MGTIQARFFSNAPHLSLKNINASSIDPNTNQSRRIGRPLFILTRSISFLPAYSIQKNPETLDKIHISSLRFPPMLNHDLRMIQLIDPKLA
jgi:hypothetical protein